MEIITSDKSKTEQPGVKPHWKIEKNGGGIGHFYCTQGNLINSVIWIEVTQSQTTNRECGILLNDSSGQFFGINPRYPYIKQVSSDYQYIGRKNRGECRAEKYSFRFNVGDKRSENLLKSINLINADSPLGQEIFSAICDHILKLDFSSVFYFVMAMHSRAINCGNLPRDVLGVIYQLFLQNTERDLLKNCSEQTKKKVTNEAIQKFKPKKREVIEPPKEAIVKAPQPNTSANAKLVESKISSNRNTGDECSCVLF